MSPSRERPELAIASKYGDPSIQSVQQARAVIVFESADHQQM